MSQHKVEYPRPTLGSMFPRQPRPNPTVDQEIAEGLRELEADEPLVYDAVLEELEATSPSEFDAVMHQLGDEARDRSIMRRAEPVTVDRIPEHLRIDPAVLEALEKPKPRGIYGFILNGCR